ncbi:MAG TPA: hypothetical protein VGI40_11765 [Pirellulaceae bacterium]|jgi:hypothetical protein
MDSRQWCDKLRGDLRRQRLPPAYIDRLVEELSDHLIDTQTETTSMDAQHAISRLGSTDQLATAATHEFRRRTFAGRHPWLTFVVAPFAFIPVLFVSFLLASFAVAWMIDTTVEWLIMPESELWTSKTAQAQAEWWILGAYDTYVRFIPFIAASWIFCRWGRHSNLRWWPLAACTIVALTAGFLFTKSVPANGDKPGLWIIGLATHFEARQFVQLIVPLVVAAWMLLRMPRGLFPSRRTQNAIAT